MIARGEETMQRHDPSEFVVPDDFWNRLETKQALRARDAGALFQLVRKYAGASQTGLTMRTGIAKSEISSIMAGRRRVTSLERFESIADGLNMPDASRVELGLAPKVTNGASNGEVPSNPGAHIRTASVASGVWSILPPVRGFRGRRDELRALRQTLHSANDADERVTATAVHGIAGVGKTQLVRAYSQAYRAEYDLGWWIPAETRLDIVTGIGQLAVRLGASEKWSSTELINYLFEDLSARKSWLIVFDNAPSPSVIESFIPRGAGNHGHVIFTSRNPSWQMLATPLGVDVLSIKSASELLSEWSHDNDQESANSLAAELGQLPLAIEQAAAYAAETSVSLSEYLKLFQAERARLLEHGSALAYPSTVAATVTLTLERLSMTSPTALRLLEVCSLCSSEILPIKEFLSAVQNIDDTAEQFDALDRLKIFTELRQSGLLSIDGDNEARLHRLTRTIVRERINDRHHRVTDAAALLNELFPQTPSEPTTWPVCAQLASHAASVLSHAKDADLLSIDLASLLTRMGRYLLCSGLSYADSRNYHAQALQMRQRLHDGDHPEVARGFVHLAVALNELGEPAQARSLHEQALEMRMRWYAGKDHADTAHSLDNLGNVLHILGDYKSARQRHEDGLHMRQRLYLADHPNIAYSLSNLAGDLHKLDDVPRARELNEQALAMRQRLDPGDHPDVAHSFANLAADLRAMGELVEAKRLAEQALAMHNRLYPGDHPNTVRSLQSLAQTYTALGHEADATSLDRQAREMKDRLRSRYQ
ncbi:FxSxx-COOH system tetratricopeptide repeat protein [Kribbella qitaiheensis]|nr:FxSxx-COOH system tetratricopeptide repeat protein [Kribbella qitaiheensis]